jgi:hypothetical protein
MGGRATSAIFSHVFYFALSFRLVHPLQKNDLGIFLAFFGELFLCKTFQNSTTIKIRQKIIKETQH